MSERFSSGDRHLDAILGGGLPANALNMIIGLPGSGKTILAEQFLFHNASPQRPGLYLSTVSEPLEKILRYGQSLEFFDAEAIGTSVFFDDLAQTLNDGDLDDVLAHVRGLATERQPRVIAIDSFKALSAYAATPRAFRHFLHELAGLLTALAHDRVLGRRVRSGRSRDRPGIRGRGRNHLAHHTPRSRTRDPPPRGPQTPRHRIHVR